MDVEIVTGLAEVDAAAWDALAGDDDPFAEHAFLAALEDSGSVGGDTGWQPVHVLVRDGGALVGALPLYAKFHSYGEYIFDWTWAAAAARVGVHYYPKLVSMAPVTPATGRRILFAEGVDRSAVTGALLEGVSHVADRLRASSVHMLFLTAEEQALVTADESLMPRLSYQFHFHNEGYGSFDDFLSGFRSAQRKQVRRERRAAADSGLDIRVLEGHELSPDDYRALSAFYFDTCHKRGSGPYLTRRFFELLPERLAHRVVAVMAYRDGRPIAGTLNFQKGQCLYGRYWGCAEEVEFLHFECCYYLLVERAIAQGLTRFEAGAQGQHKLRRGFMPVAIYSAHHIAHEGLRDAVSDFLTRETAMVREEMEALARHGPFHRT